MRISNIQSTTTFKRALTQEELTDYKKVLAEAKNVTGQTGKSIFIMPSSCLPQAKELNTGVGHIASKKAQEYYEFMSNYLGCNVVEDLPIGQVTPSHGFYSAYKSSALGLGNHLICPELLVTKEYENILTQEELSEIVNGNKSPEKETIANFKNVIDTDGAQNQVLKKAHNRFKKLDNSSELKSRYQKFVKENSDWLNFARTNEPDIDFYKFKQFLAEEHLQKGKEELNKKGLKLAGDCQIGFSADEVKAFPNAFKKNHFIGMPGWGLPALNYDNILDETSAAHKLLKRKIQLNAKRYDVIRFDVGWAYVTPIITPEGEKQVLEKNRKYLGDSLLKHIENWVKEVKGADFDLKNLIYEFDAGAEDFKAFEGNKLIQPLQNRVKIYGSTYMHNTNGDKWGYNRAFLDRGWSPDEFILGVGNHDPQPLRQIAEGTPEKIKFYDEATKDFIIKEECHKQDAIKPLSEELKISAEKLQNPVEFSKAKFAEPMMAKNNQYFYMDVFGRAERFDLQGFNTTQHPHRNYAYKVPENFEKAYCTALEEGFGFNVMDSFDKVFKAKGYDKTHSDLYSKIIKYKQILSGEVTTNTKVSPAPKSNNKFVIIAGIAAAIALLGGILLSTKKKEEDNKLQTIA